MSLIRKIPDKYKKYFICEYFDGDGSVFKYNHNQHSKEYVRVHLCGNLETM